jgi:hypothetical protein
MVVSIWWLVIESIAMLVLYVFASNLMYRRGVWDGAFNRFLPRVRNAMMEYDAERARKIIERDIFDALDILEKRNIAEDEHDENTGRNADGNTNRNTNI